MEKVKEMANQMLEELGKENLSNYPSLGRQLEIINNLCQCCKSPHSPFEGGLTSRQVIASTIVQYFSNRRPDFVSTLKTKSQGEPSPVTRR